MYSVIIDKAALTKHAVTLEGVGRFHLPELKLKHDEGSKDARRTLWRKLEKSHTVLWIVTHGNQFVALWERTENDKWKVTKEGIFPLSFLGTFLREAIAAQGIG